MLKNRLLGLLMVVGFSILSACSNKGLPEQAQPPVVQPIIVATELSSATSAAIQPGTRTEGEQVGEKPSVKTSLEATDPSTLNLANGRPTLVEFFAFW